MMTEQVENASHIESEYWLIERARSGAIDAYDDLVTRHRARAVRVARSFVRDRDLAEDIAQEAFVRTFLAIRNLRSPEAFEVYLTRTIVRLSIDHFRKSSSNEFATTEIDPPTAKSISPEESIYIRGILDKLSTKLRTVIVLRDINGMDYESIARTLRLPIGTVRSRISAARASFKLMYISGIAEEA